MKCQRCPKQATLHITDVFGDERFEEAHLCEDCAKKHLYEPQQTKKPAFAKGGDAVVEGGDADAIGGKHCDVCGLKFVEFRNHGRLGCPHDYDSFKDDLMPLLESVHGETKHAGKSPRKLPPPPGFQRELAQLKKQLAQFIADEKYEDAARVRDRIKQLEPN
jgi:protein arginine kinase activator